MAWRTLIQMDVPDRADVHYKLSQLLHKRGDTAEARRHVLLALEETPRYREALQLLLTLNRAAPETGAAARAERAEPSVPPEPPPQPAAKKS